MKEMIFCPHCNCEIELVAKKGNIRRVQTKTDVAYTHIENKAEDLVRATKVADQTPHPTGQRNE